MTATVLLDTNVVSYLLNGHTVAQRYIPHLQGKLLAISFMVVAEMHEGAARAGWGRARLDRLDATLKQYVVVPTSYPLCVEWGAIRAERRQQPISSEDAWMAATARANGWPLVSHNAADFVGIQGLTVISEV